MGKREQAHRELEHALAALQDATKSENYGGLCRVDAQLAQRSPMAWTAFSNACMAVNKLTAHQARYRGLSARERGLRAQADVRKLAPVMLDIMLGDEPL